LTKCAESKADVEGILKRLENPADASNSTELEKLLVQLHGATRTLGEGALEPLFSKRGVRIIGGYAFQADPKPEHLPALRCLNNILVRAPESRKLLATEIGTDRIISALKRDDPDDELALANIIIFSCHGTSLDLTPCFENDGLAETVSANIQRHANQGPLPTADPTSACAASLRLLSTLAARYEDQAHRFIHAVDAVLDMLSKMTILTPPLQAPVSILVNCLPVLPLIKKKDIEVSAVDKLIEILSDCINFCGTQDKESEFLPLLLAINHMSQSEAKSAKERLQQKIIPSEEDRKEALGKGQSLPHKLLHMSNMSMFPEVREVIMTTFFELSERDPSLFVHNVGFGNAAGYLNSKGIEISQKELGSAVGPAVNPITGQRLDAEPEVELPEMTDEEKEREAERLFVLFERLKATGVMDVENPVTAAMQSGRIQELPDDASDDDDSDDNTKGKKS